MTIKQARATREITEKHLKTYGQAMLRAGYKPSTANKPSNLTKSDNWRKIMAQYLPDHKLFKTHEDALTASKWNDFTGDREPDHNIRLKAVDMAYKLKGRGNDSVTSNTQINISFDGTGYIPPENVLNVKPTHKSSKPKEVRI